ncbi:uncharacterized protein TRIREDRAFT_111604 [Trichoderma reesei QM6a]|uniref:Predicted protein n=2 Tax=Hypocrea jecorina TaxID=51453 RepID=G0RUZ2_HYPJQ|nr:uncharacterized protein TRIREDRAFT_111604 [Trichoderma reesei QM6a]EGR44958.1 predicted protein [Trichoderma reesei QM6a]
MPAASTKANYKTYEAQARMVRAIVAAHPEVKWNYKEIAACYGSDMSEHALNHRFRRLRAQAVIVREGRKEGFDMKDMIPDGDLPVTQEAVEKNNIAKYFGESTPDGIGFQFRGIKKDAETLRKVESEGGDVANCLSLGTARGSSSVMSTPSKPTAFRSTGSRSGTGTGRKRARKTDMIKRSESDEEDDDDVLDGHNWSEHEDTPTKKPRTGAGAFPGQRTGTPSRRAAARANATIAEVSALLDNSDSQPEMEASSSSAAASQPTTTTTSASFAPRDASPEPPSYDRFGTRPIIGVNTGPPAVASYHSISHYGSGSQPFSGSVYDDLGDGEI